MKNIIIMGLVALLLFSVSAALSLWLNQSKEEPEKDKKKTATTKDSPKDGGEDLRPNIRPSPATGTDKSLELASNLQERQAKLAEREARVDRRATQMQLMLQDIRDERKNVEDLQKQVAQEFKLLNDKVAEMEQKAVDLDTKRGVLKKTEDELQKARYEITDADKQNIPRLASIYDTMEPSKAAPILQEMANSGKMDTAVKILATMKERNASKLLTEMTDVSLAAQLLEKMRTLRRGSSEKQ